MHEKHDKHDNIDGSEFVKTIEDIRKAEENYDKRLQDAKHNAALILQKAKQQTNDEKVKRAALVFFRGEPNVSACGLANRFYYVESKSGSLGIFFLHIVGAEEFGEYFTCLALGDSVSRVGNR